MRRPWTEQFVQTAADMHCGFNRGKSCSRAHTHNHRVTFTRASQSRHQGNQTYIHASRATVILQLLFDVRDGDNTEGGRRRERDLGEFVKVELPPCIYHIHPYCTDTWSLFLEYLPHTDTLGYCTVWRWSDAGTSRALTSSIGPVCRLFFMIEKQQILVLKKQIKLSLTIEKGLKLKKNII